MNTRLSRGFTLLETLVATGILVVASVGIASVLTSSIETNVFNRQKAVAFFLLSQKIEQFKTTPISLSEWTSGGDLNTNSPAAGYYDVVTDASQTYLRVWKISGVDTKTLQVVVCAVRRNRWIELIRASTMVGRKW